MFNVYSAHPALASEQLQRAECANGRSQHRRHSSASSSGSGCGGGGSPTKIRSSSSKAAKTTSTTAAPKFSSDDAPQKSTPSLPNRTAVDDKDDFDTVIDFDAVAGGSGNVGADNSKDCVDCVPMPLSAPPLASIDEPDYLQQRFAHRNGTYCNSKQLYKSGDGDGGGGITNIDAGLVDGDIGVNGCVSGLSSIISSPSPSTASSPFSTPTRLAPHLHHSHTHCCQKGGNGAGTASTSSSSHVHHSPHSAAVAAAAAVNGCKKLQKFDPRLPILACMVAFATVFTILIVCMDKTEIHHQQFRLNMSRDYDLYGVAQDDPTLIAYLREIHMRKYPMHFLKQRGVDDDIANISGVSSTAASATEQQLNYTRAAAAYHDTLTLEMAHYVADLVGGRLNGAAIQSLPGPLGHLMTAPWLSETLNWTSVIVEPEPRRYFALRKQNAQRQRLQVVHACVSPQSYPKEVTIHNEESEVRINSLLDEETSWFHSRVKCFPLYTIMLACTRVKYDLLSLGVHGHELEILQTLPFDKIKIDVISIHLYDYEHDDVHHIGYIQSITKFLMGKTYKLQKKFGRNYFYQRINSGTSRRRKKDILLLKTP